MIWSDRIPPWIVARLIVQRSWANRPASALMALRRSVGMRSVTDDGAPALNVTGWMSSVYCVTSLQRPSETDPPNLSECEPVTYDAESDSGNTFEEWPAGAAHASVTLLAQQ